MSGMEGEGGEVCAGATESDCQGSQCTGRTREGWDGGKVGEGGGRSEMHGRQGGGRGDRVTGEEKWENTESTFTDPKKLGQLSYGFT